MKQRICVVKKARSKPLKDFDVVTHIVRLDQPLKFRSHDGQYMMLATYINRYGLQIGALLKDPRTDEVISWDPFIWEEYLDFRSEGKKPHLKFSQLK